MKLVRKIGFAIASTTVDDTTYPAYSASTTYPLGSFVSATHDDGWVHEYESLRTGRNGTAWNSGTSYSIGDKASNTAADGFIHEYSSTQDDNLNNPTTDAAWWDDLGPINNYYLTDKSWWLDLGPKNRHAMFDDRVSTATTDTGEITVAIQPTQRFDSVIFIGLSGVQTVSVQITRSGATLFSQTVNLKESGAGTSATDWWEYFFGELDDYKTSLFLDATVAYSDVTITATLTGGESSIISCGLMMVGRAKQLAATLYGPSIGIVDYSRKETDEFGNAYFVERDYSNKGSFNLIIDTEAIDFVVRSLAAARATPYLFDFNNDGTNFDTLRLFGWYKDFDINLETFSKSYCTIEVESII